MSRGRPAPLSEALTVAAWRPWVKLEQGAQDVELVRLVDAGALFTELALWMGCDTGGVALRLRQARERLAVSAARASEEKRKAAAAAQPARDRDQVSAAWEISEVAAPYSVPVPSPLPVEPVRVVEPTPRRAKVPPAKARRGADVSKIILDEARKLTEPSPQAALEPVEQSEPAEPRRSSRRSAIALDELRHLLEQGDTFEQIAARVGVQAESLRRQLRRAEKRQASTPPRDPSLAEQFAAELGCEAVEELPVVAVGGRRDER